MTQRQMLYLKLAGVVIAYVAIGALMVDGGMDLLQVVSLVLILGGGSAVALRP